MPTFGAMSRRENGKLLERSILGLGSLRRTTCPIEKEERQELKREQDELKEEKKELQKEQKELQKEQNELKEDQKIIREMDEKTQHQ